jgi:hypothetical protein
MTKTFILLWILLGGVTNLIFAQLDLDFEVPAPAESELVQKQNFRFGGKDILALGWTSKQDPLAVKNYYCLFFQENGFKKIKEEDLFQDTSSLELKFKKQEVLGDVSIKQMRFKKKELVIDVILSSRPGQPTEIAVAKYLQPEGSPDLEHLKPSIKDSFFDLPKEDGPGKDLLNIPRPPQAIRWASLGEAKDMILVYATELTVQQAKEFYKENMPYQEWELEKEVSAGQLLDAYKKTTGKSVNIPPLFIDAEDLSGVVADTEQLEFKGQSGKAQISIMPNFVDRKLGSIVQIAYKGPDLGIIYEESEQ